MMKLYIEGSSAPLEIKKSLLDFSKNIEFHREDSKAANGYVFFGTNRVTGMQVTLKYYYWGGKAEYHAEPRQLAEIDAPNVLKILDAGLLDAKWAYFMTPTCAGVYEWSLMVMLPLGVPLPVTVIGLDAIPAVTWNEPRAPGYKSRRPVKAFNFTVAATLALD